MRKVKYTSKILRAHVDVPQVKTFFAVCWEMVGEDVLRRLLGDGAAASDSLSPFGMVLPHLLDFLPCKTVVLTEQIVLAGDDGLHHFRGDFLQRFPVLAGMETIDLGVLDGPPDHERRDPHGHPFEQGHPHETQHNEPERDPDKTPIPDTSSPLFSHTLRFRRKSRALPSFRA